MKRIVLILILFLIGCTNIKTEKTEELMGTIVAITVYGNADSHLIIDKAFDEIKRVDNLLSNFKNDSEVYFLNANGFIYNASDDLTINIEKSLYYHNISDGAFDITVQPILDLYKYSFEENKRPPTADEIKEADQLVDSSLIEVNGKNIRFRKNGMKITLGGIAKGYAIDRAIEVLEENGIKHALVNAGGDMRALGDKNGKDWKIALQNPRKKDDYLFLIDLSNKAMATSGDYERYYDIDKKYHHIINPKTGYSATELISVTIIADKAIDADALATAVFVLGKEKGMELIEKLDNVEGLLITTDKEIFRSKWFPK